MPYTVEIPGGRGTVEVADDVPLEEARLQIEKQFPPNGAEIAERLAAEPDYQPTTEEFKLYKDYAKEKQASFIDSFAQGVDYMLGVAGRGVAAGVTEGAALNPANYLEAFAQGSQQLYGMVAQSQDPNSALFKLKDLINGTGTIESQRQQFLEARKFNQDLAKYESGESTFLPKEMVNPEYVQAAAMILDPTLAIPGIGEMFGAGKLATKGVGLAARGVGRGVSALARPVEAATKAGERILAEAINVSPEALSTAARTTGLASAVGVAPAVGVVGAVPLIATTAREAGQALAAAGENLLTQPSRIGPLEAIGRIPGANLRQRTLGIIGQYGGDAALDTALRATAGSIEGGAVGAGLGYLGGGEEGAGFGAGSGAAMGAVGTAAARGYQKLTGKAAREARQGDFDRYVATQDEKTASLLRQIEDQHGLDVASGYMDATALMRGQLGDVNVTLLSAEDYRKKFGTNTRGVQIPEADTPAIYVNADIFGQGKGDSPLYTLGHEIFHALERSEQLASKASEIKDALVGSYVVTDGVPTQVTRGLFDNAEIDRRFNEYRDKLSKEQADQLAQYDTQQKRADFVASEIAAEYTGALFAGQKPDALLRGFSGLTRTLLDAALTKNSDSALNRIAQRIENTFGLKPLDSVLFPDLKQASPQVNAMLRDLVRARRRLDERILAADNEITGSIKPTDMGNPIAAKVAQDFGIAEQLPDGSVRWLSDDEINAREWRDNQAVQDILLTRPGARMVDGMFQGRFSPEQLTAIEQSQQVSSRMKDKIRAVAGSFNNGNSIFVDYNAATKRVKNKITGNYTSKYSSGIRMTQRELLPYAFYFSKADNPVIKAIDLTKVRRAVEGFVRKDGSIDGIWENMDGFMSDLAKYFTNLDSPRRQPSAVALDSDAKAKFMGDLVNEMEKGGRKFVRDFRLDRIGAIEPRNFRARISEDAIQFSKMRWMPSENVGDTKITGSEEGYRIVSKGKNRLYGPDGKLIGIYDTQLEAERKADATQARIQSENIQQERRYGNEARQTAEAGRGDRLQSAEGGVQVGRQEVGPLRYAGDVNARFMAASEADPTQPSTQAIRTAKAERAVNSLYQFDYTYKVQRPGKPSKEVTATETVAAFSFTEARDKAKKAIQKELEDKAGVLRSTVSIGQPTIKGQFAVTQLTGKNRDKTVPKIVLNPKNSQQFKSMFDAVDAALELVKYSPTLGLDSDGWIRAFSRAMNGSRASIPPAPLRLAEWVKNNDSFKTFIMDGLQRNPELVKSAVGGLNALQPIHEMARKGMIHPKMVALHMFWGLLSRMLDPYNQEAGWARLTSDPKVNRLIEESVAGQYKSSKEEWKAIVDAKMSEFPDVKIGRNAIQNANAFHEMLSRWNGRWNELTEIINNPTLDGPQMRRKFNQQGFGGAGIKHKVLSFVLATLARNDVFVGDRWQVVNLWFPHLEKAVAARKSAGGSGDVFAYDKNGVPEDTTGAYKVIGGMLNNETVAETSYSLIENAMKKIAADSPWLREILGREPQPFDIHWLTWNIIKNEPVGHSSLDATAKFLTENLYGDPEFAKKFAETEKRTEKYTKGGFDVFSVKGQERPQISQRPGTNYGGTVPADLRTYAGGSPGGLEGPSAAKPGSERYLPADSPEQSESRPGDRGGRVSSGGFAPLAGAPNVKGATGPAPGLVDVARSYAARAGIPYRRQAVYVDVDENLARRIANAYAEMKHAPLDPKVKEAYADMIRQTKDQYQALVDAGYQFTFFDSKNDPYAGNPFDAMRDLRANKRMAVYGTYDGFGTEGITGVAIQNNPMLALTGLKWPDQQGVLHDVTANDLFRAVHDAFGHALEGSGFRARGEENAWQAHIRLFTGPARGAVTTETRGQNSWLNFGPYGERNRTAKLEDTVFADQKTGLMPEWTWSEGIAADEPVPAPAGGIVARKMPEGFQFMPSDSDYLAAVKSGDTAKAQELVDQAAKAAGLFNGLGKRLSKWAANDVDNSIAKVSFRNPDTGEVNTFGDVANDFRSITDERAVEYVRWLQSVSFKTDKQKDILSDIVFLSRVPQVVSRDLSGNVIPLSQRFQQSSADIRYMPDGSRNVPKHYESVDSFREHWNALGVRNMTDIRSKGTPYEHIRPSEIEVEKANRNKGLGTAFMNDLVQFADFIGKQIRINPSAELGATSKSRLEKFYKRFGFVENKPGKNKDYSISERFYRQPSSAGRFMPSTLVSDATIPGAYSMSGYRVLPGKSGGRMRVYSPTGSLIGIAASTDEAQRLIQKKLR